MRSMIMMFTLGTAFSTYLYTQANTFTAHQCKEAVSLDNTNVDNSNVSTDNNDRAVDLTGTCLDPTIDPDQKYPSLPRYTFAEVSKHADFPSIWVVLNGCVYDITEFASMHPGGDRILAAKGDLIEPYWMLYPIHYQSKLVLQYLDTMRIGVLCREDRLALQQKLQQDTPSDDIFAKDPTRHPKIHALLKKPFNGETPLQIVGEDYITPTPLVFVRNHHHVPKLTHTKDQPYTITVSLTPSVWNTLQSLGYTFNTQTNTICKHTTPVSSPDIAQYLALQDNIPTLSIPLPALQKLCEEGTVTNTLICAGNRRSEMNLVAPTDGLAWGIGAISTNTYTGPRLADIFGKLGITESLARRIGADHIQMTAKDDPFRVSIPANKGLTYTGDVVLAHTMDNAPIPPDHGYPLRAVVPGYVGVRNLKWVSSITLSQEEVHSPWQSGIPYKLFPPYTKSFKDSNPKDMVSVHAYPVVSAITKPLHKYAKLVTEDCEQRQVDILKQQLPLVSSDIAQMYQEPYQCVSLKGWAYAGDGAGIQRVDLTTTDGELWNEGELVEGPSRTEIEARRAWAWSLWEGQVVVPNTVKTGDTVTCKVRAVDGRGNAQPEQVKHIWNKRGIINNAWYAQTYTLEVPNNTSTDHNEMQNEK